MTTATAPAPTVRSAPAPKDAPKDEGKPNPDKAQAKTRLDKAQAKTRLDTAIGALCRLEEDGAPVLSFVNRNTWVTELLAWKDRRLALHSVIGASPTDLSRHCADGKDRSSMELADYLVGMRATRGDLKKDRRAWATPRK